MNRISFFVKHAMVKKTNYKWDHIQLCSMISMKEESEGGLSNQWSEVTIVKYHNIMLHYYKD